MTIKIGNKNLLTDRFGYWPSFHDAEILRARFERDGPDAPWMECDIHVFEMTSEVDSAGHYVLKKHTLVTLRFCDIGLEEFKWWNHQNAISSLHIGSFENPSKYDRQDWTIGVVIGSSYGCESKLVCTEVKVISVDDFNEGQPGTASTTTNEPAAGGSI
jgi:Immunity protein 50